MVVNYQAHIRQLCVLLVQYFIFAFLVLFIARGVFFFAIQDLLPKDNISDDIWRAFFVGGRFDAKVTAIAYAPLLLSGLLCAAFYRGYQRWLTFSLYYHGLIVFLYVAGSIGNYYYYLTYGNHVDVIIFGLWEDDTKAVLANIWSDYPIVISFLIAVFIGCSAYFSSRQFLNRRSNKASRIKNWHWVTTTLVIVISISLTFLTARGSVGSLPLKRYHASVSQVKELNTLTPNVFMALDWAISDYKKQSHFKPVSKTELTRLMQEVLGQKSPDYRTPYNEYLQDNPPHVVMTMMESMGMNILVEDNTETNDLLGSFRPYKEDGFWFERFAASASMTIDSIVMTLFHSPVATISHSSIQKKSLPSSVVLPYKKAGYRVVFIYGGNSMWRNLANYLPLQGFDRVYDENDITELFPEAKEYSGVWGVPDEYTFKFANTILEESEKPTFVYIMTVTNHSPFKTPEDYKPKRLTLTPRLQSLFEGYGEKTQGLLETFQYSIDSLGQFISKISQSEKLKNNTIIAVTGDHRMRYGNVESQEIGLSQLVPFYLKVPQSILNSSDYRFDPKRIGSHRDIFPTLYHFSLSNTNYISLGGENILSSDDVTNIGYNKFLIINRSGVMYTKGNGELYPWSIDDHLLNEERASLQHQLDIDWGNKYSQLQEYYLRSQVLPMTP